jgi:outer membrane protein assembly factor BamB
MARTPVRPLVAAIFSLGILTAFVVGPPWATPTVELHGQQSTTKPSTANGEWPAYTADVKGTRYSPLDQINASNFNSLEVAWRVKTDPFGPFPEYKLEGTPLMVKGVLYTTAGTRRSVIALDAKTGELMWSHSYREGRRAGLSPRQLSGHGVAFWTDGRGDDRVVYVTTGYRLIELNAKTGAMIASFGTGGVVDLKAGVVYGNRQPIDLESGEIGIHSTPTVAGDVVLVGSSFREGATVSTHNNTKGLVRAFDARTGKVLWTFNTIPRPGEFGNETWENDSWSVNGNTGVWTQISVDEELGLAYLPIETPSSDFYGGHRPGNNLFAETLVAVDLKTGQRKWHYQFVHHPIWNFDNCCASLLLDINVNGRAIKAVAQPSKQGFLYVLDRVSGQPVWPIEERPVAQSDVPGEKTSPTQPFPTKPPPYARNYLKLEDVIDFTPELRREALDVLKRYKVGDSPFTPPVAGNVNGILGAIGSGTATNWPWLRGRSRNAHRLRASGERAVGALGRGPAPGFLRHSLRVGHRRARFHTGDGTWAIAAPLIRDAGRATICPTTVPPAPAGGRAGTPPATSGAAAGASARGGSTSRDRHTAGGRWWRGAGGRRRPDRSGTSHRQAAVRDADGDQSRSRRHRLAGAARRHARQHPQPRRASRADDSENRTGRDIGRRPDGHQDARRDGRSAGDDDAGAAAWSDAAGVRQATGKEVGAVWMPAIPKRLAHDLQRRWQAVHRRRDQRRPVHGRVSRAATAVTSTASSPACRVTRSCCSRQRYNRS